MPKNTHVVHITSEESHLSKTNARMSSLTTEYMVKQSENSVRYDILVNDFHKKIKTFKNGRHIYSRTFRIGQSKFEIEIYPNGLNKKDKGNTKVTQLNVIGRLCE